MFNWLTDLFTGREALRPAPHIEAVAQHNGFFAPHLTETTAQANAYTRSPWVYVAVSRIAEAVALTPLSVYRLAGERRVPVENHPLERLLRRPNPFMSRFELLEQTVGMLELTGNAYWFLSGDGEGMPREVWPLRPDRISVVPDPKTFVRGYIYEIAGTRIPLEKIEIIHFKRWHPLNDYYGLSALEAASSAIHTDRAMAAWNRNTFGQDNGVPAGIVTLPETTNADDFERVKREWRASYGGPHRRTAFLRAGGATWQSIAHNHTDMDFLRGRQANRDEILNIFGLPVGLVSENATEANARVAERTFIERTLYPKLVRLAAALTTDLLPFYERDAVVEFEDIRPTDTQARMAEINTAAAVLTVNEIRARYYNLTPVTWGDVPAAAVPDTIRAAVQPEPPSPASDAKTVALDELRQWERFTLRRLDNPARRPFEIKAIPDDLALQVRAGLTEAGQDEAAVRQIFEAARKALRGEAQTIETATRRTETESVSDAA
jgi:HK97 family phage portal protein